MSVDVPFLQRRRLATALRAYREQRGLTQKRVAESLDWSESKVIRFEACIVCLTPVDTRALLTFYGVTDDAVVSDLVAAARSARAPSGWGAYRKSLSPEDREYLSSEQAAALTRTWGALVIPDMLRTSAYQTALFQGDDALIDPGNAVKILTQRQGILQKDPGPRRWEFLLDESCLHSRVGGADVLSEQLLHLQQCAALPHVSLRVLPYDNSARCVFGAFSVHQFDCAGLPPRVYAYSADAVFLPRPLTRPPERVTAAFTRAFDAALSDDDSLTLLRKRREGIVASPCAVN
jgi:transcriptional regulator with XRE-family HTH domain